MCNREQPYFKDLTIVIPFRKDVPEREENLKVLLFFLKELKGCQILIIEADHIEHLHNLPQNIKKIFIHDDSNLFHRTRYVNEILSLIQTTYLGIWDNDVLIPIHQTQQAFSLLKQGIDIVIPHNGVTLEIPGTYRQDIIKNPKCIKNITTTKQNMFGHFSVGGIFFISTALFRQSGGENEYICGWGPEDLERIKRWEILNYQIRFLKAPLFHLSHSRNSINYQKSELLTTQNRQELLKICSMTTQKLQHYISTWPWFNHL